MEKQAIRELILAMETSALEQWNSGDPSGFLAIYAKDITYFDPFQQKRIDGLDNMRAFYAQFAGQGGGVDRYEMIDPVVTVTEDVAVMSYNLNSWAGDRLYPWNCTEVYRREKDGTWKIVHNHWSFIRPMELDWLK